MSFLFPESLLISWDMKEIRMPELLQGVKHYIKRFKYVPLLNILFNKKVK